MLRTGKDYIESLRDGLVSRYSGVAEKVRT